AQQAPAAAEGVRERVGGVAQLGGTRLEGRPRRRQTVPGADGTVARLEHCAATGHARSPPVAPLEGELPDRWSRHTGTDGWKCRLADHASARLQSSVVA